MTTWVNASGHLKLVFKEGPNSPGRYMEFDLTRHIDRGCHNRSGVVYCDTQGGYVDTKVSQTWQDIVPSSNQGWIYDVDTEDFGYIMAFGGPSSKP